MRSAAPAKSNGAYGDTRTRGTIVKDAHTGRIMADISDDEPVVIAKGGRGGWGNSLCDPYAPDPAFCEAGFPWRSL